MDLLTFIIKHATIPLYDIKHGRNISAPYKALVKSQYLTPGEIEMLQLTRLKSIVRYAQNHCGFYRDRLHDIGFDPEKIQSPDDIENIPILTKDDIRANLNRMISDEFEIQNLVYKRTGGSTSVPLALYQDKQAHRIKSATTVRHNEWTGYYRGDKLAALWGDTDKQYSLKERLYNLLYNRVIYLDTLKIDDESMLMFVKEIHRFKPPILLGHAHSLYVFACFVADNNIKDINFRGIISTAEMLYDHERQKIESVFGEILFNRYGCEELGLIASECEERDGLHINAEGLLVEVLGGDENSPGRLVITDLMNRGMPLIRYEIGDMATVKTGLCSCGRGLPRLGSIYGRTSDYLYAPDGTRISGISILDTFVIHIKGFKQVQIIQDELDCIAFKIIKDRTFSETSLDDLQKAVSAIFGPKMRHKTEFVDKIPKTARGKYQFTVCNIGKEESHK
jgi:phenylacetate-CoA ligase